MKVLIIEDDYVKYVTVSKFVYGLFPDVLIKHAGSYNSGLRTAVSEFFDVILLDMTLPTFDVTNEDDGGRPFKYAGKEILRQLDRRGVESKVIIVTQFDTFGSGDDVISLDQLIYDIKNKFYKNYSSYVFYSALTDSWKEELADALNT